MPTLIPPLVDQYGRPLTTGTGTGGSGRFLDAADTSSFNRPALSSRLDDINRLVPAYERRVVVAASERVVANFDVIEGMLWSKVLLSTVYAEAVQAHPACVSLAQALQWQTPESKETRTNAGIVTFSAREVVPLGAKNYHYAVVEMKLESQIDDTGGGDETHLARANLLLAAVKDENPTTCLRHAINTAVPRRLVHKGHVLTGGGRGQDGRNWTASVLLKVLFAPAP